MSKDKLATPEDNSVQSALHKVHSEQGDGFAVFGFPAGNNVLAVIAEGAGTLADAQSHLPDDDVRYVLLRKTHKVELAMTTKFAFISWTPEGIKPLRKAMLSTYLPQVIELLKPHHVTFNWSTRGELNEQDVLARIGASSGTASHVVEARPEAKQAGAKGGPSLVPSAIKDDRKLNIVDEEALTAAVKQVRLDSSEINWVLIAYTDDKVDTLHLVGSGSGGVDELASKLDNTQVMYGLFRVSETFDKTQRAMFGFFKLLSPQHIALPPLKKALVSTHMGFVQRLFQPFHVEFLLDSASELSSDIAHARLQSMMGTRSNVRTAEEAKSLKPAGSQVSKHSGPSVPSSASATAKIGFVDEEAFRAALKDVRSDSSPTTWLLCSYPSKDTLAVVQTGGGPVEDLVAHLEDAHANFGLIRVTEQIDKSVTTKFVYIKWMPESVPYMRKADLSTKKGPIDDLFRPFHVDLQVSEKSELSSAIIADKVASASGAKNNVRAS